MPIRLRLLVYIVLYITPVVSAFPQEERVIPITYDSSRCDYCRMFFQEKKFGGEVETLGDSILIFDASECMAAFMIAGKIPLAQVKKMWSVNYLAPNIPVDAGKAWYLHSDKLMSPMEANIAAFPTMQAADSVRLKLGGETMDWEGVLHFIRTRWFQKQ
jgi:copper chaperone NosL